MKTAQMEIRSGAFKEFGYLMKSMSGSRACGSHLAVVVADRIVLRPANLPPASD